MAYRAGHKVNLVDTLRQELLPVPMSIAEIDGSIRTGIKAILCDLLTKSMNCLSAMTVDQLGPDAALVLDGQALIISIEKESQRPSCFY